MFAVKDFIETEEGLLFAVVDYRLEDGKVLCFLRYAKDGKQWEKKNTQAANALLEQKYPHYLHYSKKLDTTLHAVDTDRIIKHHQPGHRLQEIMLKHNPDHVERDLRGLCGLFQQNGLNISQTGITGSLLIGAQQDTSDIDLVCYGRPVFHQCRTIVKTLISNGQLQALQDADWQESYRRRDCSLNYEDYVWHERRKFNKALINGRKFDLNLIEISEASHPANYRKCGNVNLQGRILDDRRGFDYPAVYKIDHETVQSIICFTATYTGQAFVGEKVEVSGVLEHTEEGLQVLVGSTREAHGEYIKVIDV